MLIGINQRNEIVSKGRGVGSIVGDIICVAIIGTVFKWMCELIGAVAVKLGWEKLDERSGYRLSDVVEKTIGCTILLLLIVGICWYPLMTVFSIVYLLFGGND